MHNVSFTHRLRALAAVLLIAAGSVAQPVEAQPVAAQPAVTDDPPGSSATSEGRFLPDGSFYQGDLVQGQPDGFGTRVFRDGRRYSGHFKSGQMHGIGVMIWPGGDRYEGAWLEDIATGSGVLRFADGNLYRGEFRNGIPHGKGNFTYNTGDLYEGFWHAGSQHGKGKMTYANGGFYEGTFLNGLRHGEGLLVTAKGERYQGPFRDDLRHGDGLCGAPDKQRPCHFAKDKLLADSAKDPARPRTNETTSSPDTVAVQVPQDIPDDMAGLYEDAQALSDTANNLELDTITLPVISELPAIGAPVPAAVTPPSVPARAATKQPTHNRTPAPTGEPPAPTPLVNRTEPPAENLPNANNGAQFGEQLHQALETMKPVYRLEELTADISEIRFHHDSPVVDTRIGSAKIEWNKKRALLGSRLDIFVDVGKASMRVELPYEGPGDYQLKPGWLVYREDDSEFRCEQTSDCLLTIVEDASGKVSGRFELTLQQQKRRFPETRTLENGVFVLRPARFGSR